jgi:hypothetical protein
MSREHLIENRPALKPEDDAWMLDRWSTPEGHVVRVVYWDRRLAIGNGRFTTERVFRSACRCGWRSIETLSPQFVDSCPVFWALDDRHKRIRKDTERIEWQPYIPPHVEPDSRD